VPQGHSLWSVPIVKVLVGSRGSRKMGRKCLRDNLPRRHGSDLEGEHMKDKGTCPYCQKEFEVSEYGKELDCPNCGRKIDVFPDSVWLDTKWGMIGVPVSILSLITK